MKDYKPTLSPQSWSGHAHCDMWFFMHVERGFIARMVTVSGALLYFQLASVSLFNGTMLNLRFGFELDKANMLGKAHITRASS